MQPHHLAPVVSKSEEKKYRQKCKDLKARIQEIQDDNAALNSKLEAVKRAIRRARLERAFLLEQVEKASVRKAEQLGQVLEIPPPPPPAETIKIRFNMGGASSVKNTTDGEFTESQNDGSNLAAQ
ncbi:Ino80 complex HMG box protein Nht1 [Schizosaccharomyces japonicus yFS275]|uniref:Ino80 complex HMG box protein Nht1 n=1 Tax=Schizosaccharomyces japonicus (strain yFS275 / FY16936) TaxID=402676 RepID=B6K8E2_SCHJY|nr:Ino80 complex HMG box protein Nht1 [Schizosaccharomyces japonicus yFS275]EEB09796.1 Ino80 complex HMG box protein Nht1 [Schizosaccharomyces japonicus yFS275]